MLWMDYEHAARFATFILRSFKVLRTKFWSKLTCYCPGTCRTTLLMLIKMVRQLTLKEHVWSHFECVRPFFQRCHCDRIGSVTTMWHPIFLFRPYKMLRADTFQLGAKYCRPTTFWDTHYMYSTCTTVEIPWIKIQIVLKCFPTESQWLNSFWYHDVSHCRQ